MAENNDEEQAFSKLKEMRRDPINKVSLRKADTKNCYTIVYNGKKKKQTNTLKLMKSLPIVTG